MIGITPGRARKRRLVAQGLNLESRFLSRVHRIGDKAVAIGGEVYGPRFLVVFIFFRCLLRRFAAGGGSPRATPGAVGIIHFECNPFQLKCLESWRPAPRAPVGISGPGRGRHTPPGPRLGAGGAGTSAGGQRAADPIPPDQVSPLAEPPARRSPRSPLFSHSGRSPGPRPELTALTRSLVSTEATRRSSRSRLLPRPATAEEEGALPQGATRPLHPPGTLHRRATSRGGALGRKQPKEDQNKSPPSSNPGDRRGPPLPTQTHRKPRRRRPARMPAGRGSN